MMTLEEELHLTPPSLVQFASRLLQTPAIDPSPSFYVAINFISVTPHSFILISIQCSNCCNCLSIDFDFHRLRSEFSYSSLVYEIETEKFEFDYHFVTSITSTEVDLCSYCPQLAQSCVPVIELQQR